MIPPCSACHMYTYTQINFDCGCIYRDRSLIQRGLLSTNTDKHSHHISLCLGQAIADSGQIWEKMKFQFAIDRGGTFTDVWARCPDGRTRVLKLLSEDPAKYSDAPREGIRRILEQVSHTLCIASEKLTACHRNVGRLASIYEVP